MAVNLAQFESVLARPGPVDVVSTGESGENVKPIEQIQEVWQFL
jgi:hypothetical protein